MSANPERPMFCSSCGQRLLAAPPTRCPSCGVHHWNNAKPCSGALVVRDSRLLLVRRACEPWKGRWDIPGGFCDAAEHPIRTAQREVREETGISIEVVGLLGMWLDEYDEMGDRVSRTLNIYYHAVPTGAPSSPLDAAEVAEIGWFRAPELPDRDHMAFVGHMPDVLAAWKRAASAGEFVTPLLDRP